MHAAVSLTSVTLTFGTTTVFQDVTWDFPVGGIVGVTGPNGAGKSTLFRLICGLVPPDAGAITVGGHPVGTPQAVGRVRAAIGEPRFAPHLSARQTLRYRAYYRGVSPDPIDDVLRRCGLDRYDRVRVGRYSQGMLKRLSLADLIVAPAQVMMLDEPFSGLDPEFVPTAIDVIRDLRQADRTVLISSHDQETLTQVGDRFVDVRGGGIAGGAVGR